MTAVARDRFVIVDNCLVDSRGHHLNLSTTLSHCALRAGSEVTWYTHQSLPETVVPQGVTVQRRFSRSTYQLLAEGRDDIDLSADYVDALRDIGSSNTGRTRVLFHTADGHVFRALAQLARSAARELPDIAVHVSTPYESRLMPGRATPIDPALLQLAASQWLGRGLYPWAETQRLARILRNAYRLAVEELPLPAPHWADDESPQVKGSPRLQVAYLGAAREDKGFCQLSALAVAVASDRSLSDKIQFTIQASPPQRGYRPALKSEIEALRRIPSVSLISDHLPPEQYQALVKSSDVVLMLYDVAKYSARGSGIAIEALSAGKFLLATSGMFLEDLPAQDAIVYGSDAQQWVRALRVWSADVPKLRDAGIRLGIQFRRRHAATAYLQRMAERERATSVQGPRH